jgi:hypothetical protein
MNELEKTFSIYGSVATHPQASALPSLDAAQYQRDAVHIIKIWLAFASRKMIQKYLNKRGSGPLMIGGQESTKYKFTLFSFHNTRT